jgi:hypothetical protein
MELILQNLDKWMEGLSPLLTSVIILWVFTIVAFRKAFAEKVKNFEWNKLFGRKKRMKKIELLKDHDLFNVIERVKGQVRLKKFYTSGKFDKVKSKMFYDFLAIYLNRTRDMYKDFLLNPALSEMGSDSLKAEVFTLMNESRKASSEEVIKKFLDKNLNPDDVDYVVMLFEQWRNETYEAVNTRISGIFSSDFHSTNFERLLACFEILSMSIGLITKDGFESFEKLNGRFQHLNYK